MNVVLFAPEDLQLVKETPAIRRKFIDMELGQNQNPYTCQICQATIMCSNKEIPT